MSVFYFELSIHVAIDLMVYFYKDTNHYVTPHSHGAQGIPGECSAGGATQTEPGMLGDPRSETRAQAHAHPAGSRELRADKPRTEPADFRNHKNYGITATLGEVIPS